MRKWRCKFCGYFCDEAVGIPDAGIQTGTCYGYLPADWSGPNCDAEKYNFQPTPS